ncbi:hypothetical protein [Pseudodesulfovibrio piezophilus]|uniref:Uncharacterized protein n=1 Tax=Pseudodesulfovibrio piezophilus (strain DSM 21447 / JCM 15486 / C1TLV30) TaxID=1322246 RepID=M1WUJ2_PSEP2|nr:hypothetical protein [Pseudodesulfovibrio piezophilus]CCH47433.1 conserved exported protein of unknown function [Pseudodesulfovibrio piezophilus C1TLV30]
MNRHYKAVILVALALILAAGAYFLILAPDTETSEIHQPVNPPSEKTVKAPDWVNKGQESKPDYSPATTEAHNATPVPEEEEATVIEIKEDGIVSFSFVQSLTDFLLNNFIPQNKQGMPETRATAKSLNMYYGLEMKGFSVRSDDIRFARKTVLDYVFTPTKIRALYELYRPVLMAQLLERAKSDERTYRVSGKKEQRTLSNKEIRAMLELNAKELSRIARVFLAIAQDPSITNMTGKYLQAAKAVKRANERLQNTIADGQDTTLASNRLKQAIMQREQDKKSVILKLKQVSPGSKDADLFYLAQWSYRRVLGEPQDKLPSFAVASEILGDLAHKFKNEAENLKQ